MTHGGLGPISHTQAAGDESPPAAQRGLRACSQAVDHPTAVAGRPPAGSTSLWLAV